MTAIETHDLTKRFGETVAVDDVSLTVDDGEVFGFLGPNGAGKSTILDLLLGFTRPTAGSVSVLGHDPWTERTAVVRRAGLLPEGVAGYRNLTAREHVCSASAAKDADTDPDTLLDRVGLDPADARRPVGEYSMGMRQRAALAVALVGAPDLLVLDEPSSGLDPNGVRQLREIVGAEADRGATVVFSSHRLDAVEAVSDRVGIIRDGTLVALDSLAKLRREHPLDSTVRVTVERVPDTEALTDIDGVERVTVERDTVTLTCTDPAAKMAAIRRLEAETTVRDVDTDSASLATLFDELTRSTDAAADPTATGGEGR